MLMLRQITPIASLLMGAAFLLAGGGLQGILLPVRGQVEGFTPLQIGWIGTAYAVGFTAGCIVIPHIVRRVGHVRVFGALSALLSIAFLGSAIVVNAPAWALLRAISGLCFAGCYMVMESWLNERISNENRGFIFSVYMVVTQIAMMGGQYLLVVADASADTLFMLGAILYSMALLPTALSKAQSPAPLTQVNLDLIKLYRNSPAAAFGAILSGIISSAWTNFAPVFGQQAAMSAAGIATLMALAMIGSVAFQFPLGRLSDMVDRRYVMGFAGILGAVLGFVLTAFAAQSNYSIGFYTSIVLYGGVIFSIYALTVAHANDHADPEDFVQTASGLLILFGFGTMAGPLLAAVMMDIFGPSGLFTTTTIAHFMFAGYALYRTFRRDQAEEADRSDFRVVPMTRAQTPETYNLDPRSDAEYYEND
ncbi:MAG: MFS transporter [Pseudomonadota bacterium]